jgi:hypothetical protein
MIELCCLCPGKAYLEGGDMEAPLEYYCELTHARREALVNNRQLIT